MQRVTHFTRSVAICAVVLRPSGKCRSSFDVSAGLHCWMIVYVPLAVSRASDSARELPHALRRHGMPMLSISGRSYLVKLAA